MEQSNQQLWKSTMTSGAFLGLALVVFSILLVFIDITRLNLMMIFVMDIIPMFFIVIGIVWGTKKYRDTILEGNITYGNALITGTLIVLFASIISAFYSYFYNSVIDPSYAERTTRAILDKTILFLQSHGVPDSQLEQYIQLKSKPLPTALESALNSIPLSTMVGFVISLITSAFLRKDKNIFEEETPNTQY